MTYAVNLYLNQEAENHITHIWHQLSALEKGKCLTCCNSRPHITLAIYEEVDLEEIQKRLKTFAQNIHSFHLQFLQIGIFPHPKGTIFLTPNLTDELFKLHRDFHEAFMDYQGQGWDYYKPNAWYPHCTLALETPLEEIPCVLGEILKVFKPMEVCVGSIGIASLDPIEYLMELQLAKE